MLRASGKLFQFSKQSKNVKFQFQAPININAIVDQLGETKNKQVKMVKLNRKKISNPAIKPTTSDYQDKTEYMSKTQANYMRNVQQKIEQNLSTRRFYNYEILRGEDLIDDIPVDPYYEYKMEDLMMEFQAHKRKVQELTEQEDPRRLQKLKQAVSHYQTMKHRYEEQQFNKKLKEYPGSQKGPNPEDDPFVYSQYVNKIMPFSLKAKLNLKSKGSLIQEDEKEKQMIDLGSSNITDYLSQDRKITQPKSNSNEDDFFEQMVIDIQNTVHVVPYSDVPILPNIKFQQYHSFLKKCQMWQKFRNYYDRANKKKELQKLAKILSHMGEKPKFKKGKNKKTNKENDPKIYSLFTYYKTLPKQVQQHPGVRTVYLGLQYSQADATYDQKVQLLNEAAKYSLPMDKFSVAAMEQLLKCRRKYLTPHLTDRIFNMNPEFTWDIKQFLGEVKDQKLRSISTVKQKQESYPEPPQLHLRWEQGMAVLPVDFYDNEDGFWSEHIDKKLQRYEKAQPLSKKPKKHLVH